MSHSSENGNERRSDAQNSPPKQRWDAFLSHATEDKDSLVRPLAICLNRLGAEVWYDEFTLHAGDSLSRSIDRGLTDSRYGIVIISPHFIQKPWTEYELRGLNSLELQQGRVIIPVWHEVTAKQVLNFSPPLADKLAVRTLDLSPQEVAIQLLRVIRPDLYAKHPRSELARLASGEALKALQAELATTKVELSTFKCPTCGAPVEKRGPMFGLPEGEDKPLSEAFECGYEQIDGYPYRLCPSDPSFPAFEDYELILEYREDHPLGQWGCTAKPKSESAEKVQLYPVLGATRQEVEQKMKEQYRRAATKYQR